MHRPFEPFDGVIIDMRNVPIALAGAFLGWRGLLPCLGIAVATRMGIGGVGMVSGIAAMAMSGLAGMIWARKMATHRKRNFGMLLYLALAMSCHLLAAVVLPRDVALWFFTTAAGPILALNLLAVPSVGALLERENRRIAKDLRMQVALARGADGLLAGPSLVRELTAAFASQPYGTFAGLLVVRGRRDFWHMLKAGTQEGCWNMAPTLACLAPLLEQGHLAGRSLDGALILPVTADEVRRGEQIMDELHAALAGTDQDGFEPALSAMVTSDPADFLKLVERMALSGQSRWPVGPDGLELSPLRPGSPSARRKARLFDPAKHNALFAKAEHLMERDGL